MSTAYLDLHVLQSLPPSNINRDDTGSPKSAVFGGVRRARVSSQSWKRAIRRDFDTYLDKSELGVRSKRLVALIADRITEIDNSLKEKSEEMAAEVLKVLGIKIEKPKRGKKEESEVDPISESGYLIFLSNLQIETLAQHAVELEHSGEKPKKATVSALVQRDHSVDIALFGRMVADIVDLNVDAAAQVAHAISVHGVDTEFDYFTAVDDHGAGEHAGAGMIGTVEFNSSMLYRYATVNLAQLHKHLGDPAATSRAVQAFTQSFARSMPTGKQNTFANRTLPHAIVATLRTDQPVNMAGAFENSIENRGDRLKRTAEAFVAHSHQLDSAFGRPEGTQTWVVRASNDMSALSELGDVLSLDDMNTQIGNAVLTTVDQDS